jgi:hypothetical protein
MRSSPRSSIPRMGGSTTISMISWLAMIVLVCQSLLLIPTATAADVDGGWSSWSYCNATQTRTCDNPPPEGAGANCIGPSIQTCADGGWSNYTACMTDYSSTRLEI